MKAWRILAFAFVVSAATAFASPGDGPPRVELPLGPYVRPGRPLDVRVIGGADRVRAPGTPWALPQGERGDEFLLQPPQAAAGLLTLEIERSGHVERISTTVEVLPEDAHVVGVHGDGAVAAGDRAVRLPATGLPTVPEGWLLFDGLAPGLAPDDVEIRLGRVESLSGWGRSFAEPLLLPPDAAAFATAARAAVEAPMIPTSVGVLLALLAGVEVTLVVVLHLRIASPWRRTAWLGLPPIAALVFIVVGQRLPGALSATAIALDGGFGRLVVVRVEARRNGSARFVLPPQATSAAMVRFSADDATVAGASAGREVVLDLHAGESRLFAYAFHEHPAGETVVSVGLWEKRLGAIAPVPDVLRPWIEGHGLAAEGDPQPFTSASLPRAEGTVVVAGAHALAATR